MTYARRPSCPETFACAADSICCNGAKIMAYHAGLVANADLG
jgi:hypothetical protein